MLKLNAYLLSLLQLELDLKHLQLVSTFIVFCIVESAFTVIKFNLNFADFVNTISLMLGYLDVLSDKKLKEAPNIVDQSYTKPTRTILGLTGTPSDIFSSKFYPKTP